MASFVPPAIASTSASSLVSASRPAFGATCPTNQQPPRATSKKQHRSFGRAADAQSPFWSYQQVAPLRFRQYRHVPPVRPVRIVAEDISPVPEDDAPAAPYTPEDAPSLARTMFMREAQKKPDTQIDLSRAALCAAKELVDPDMDVEAYVAQLDEYARRVEELLPDESRYPMRVVKAINTVLYGPEDAPDTDNQYFKGDININDPKNSLLNYVLDRKIGIPITLALIYIEVARRVGLELEALNLPGMVVTGLVRPVDPNLEFFVDPFRRGDIIFTEDCEARLSEVYGHKVKLSPQSKERSDTNVRWKTRFLGRLIHNFKMIHLEGGKMDETIKAIELMLVLYPGAPIELRDRGFCRFFKGRFRDAKTDLILYLDRVPNPDDEVPVKKLLREIDEQILQSQMA